MAKGDLAHANLHKHGIQVKSTPPAPLTLEQRVLKLETLAGLQGNGKPLDLQIEEAREKSEKEYYEVPAEPENVPDEETPEPVATGGQAVDPSTQVSTDAAPAA